MILSNSANLGNITHLGHISKSLSRLSVPVAPNHLIYTQLHNIVGVASQDLSETMSISQVQIIDRLIARLESQQLTAHSPQPVTHLKKLTEFSLDEIEKFNPDQMKNFINDIVKEYQEISAKVEPFHFKEKQLPGANLSLSI